MSVMTPSITFPQPTIPTVPVVPLTVDQYHAMIAAGILTEDDPIELLAGLLVPKMSKNPPHRAATRLTRTALEAIIPTGYYVDSQEPVTLADSEPEPDVSVIRGDTRDYVRRHPGPADVVLLVEVAETTLDRDRGLKLGIYAAAGVPVYWIVNLIDQKVEVFSRPIASAYLDRREFGSPDEIPVTVDGQLIGRVRVADVLP